MGCNPSKSEPNLQSPITVTYQHTESAQFLYSSTGIRPNVRKATKERTTRSRRGVTLSPRSCSVSPIRVNDFWGTMPLSVIIDRLNLFYEEVSKEKGNFQECVEFIQHMFEDLVEDFENSQFRVIKKNNSKFKQFVGRYVQGMLLVRSLGFRENEGFLKVDDGLTIANMKHKIKELDLAMRKVMAGERNFSAQSSM